MTNITDTNMELAIKGLLSTCNPEIVWDILIIFDLLKSR